MLVRMSLCQLHVTSITSQQVKGSLAAPVDHPRKEPWTPVPPAKSGLLFLKSRRHARTAGAAARFHDRARIATMSVARLSSPRALWRTSASVPCLTATDGDRCCEAVATRRSATASASRLICVSARFSTLRPSSIVAAKSGRRDGENVEARPRRRDPPLAAVFLVP